jgi:hypothetical protein
MMLLPPPLTFWAYWKTQSASVLPSLRLTLPS